jgi:hypothetical protein
LGIGVVDQDVDPAELLPHPREDVADLFAVGHVHLDGGRTPAHLPDLLGRPVGVDPALRGGDLGQRGVGALRRRLELGVVLQQDVRDHHVRPHPGQRQGVLAAQPARGAGD